MIDYDIAQLAKRSKKRRRGEVALITPQSASIAATKQYQALLRAMIRSIAGEANKTMRQVLLNQKGKVRDNATWFTAIKEKVATLEAALFEKIKGVFDLEALRGDKAFIQQAKKVLGIDILSVIQAEDLQPSIEMHLARNIALIKSLNGDIIKKIEERVYSSIIGGRSAKDLSEDMQRIFKVSRNRADLIATDQMSKLRADMNMIRQKQAGVKKYVWRTSQDERVRDRHKKLDGNVYRWGQKTGAEEGRPPSQPIRCRCVAIAVVEF